MSTDPHAPPRADSLTSYTTETGTTVGATAGPLAVTIEGCLDEEEAVAAITLTLDGLAKRRGVQPARIADRTPANLIAALRQP